jgi:TPR repeat protein
MNMLGRFHEEGWDRPRNPVLAVEWYRRAAIGGDYRGQYNFGSALAQQGRYADALPWFERALAAGDPDFIAEVASALAGSAEPRFQALAELASASPPSARPQAA